MTYFTVALAMALGGPGRYSFDAATLLRLPASLVGPQGVSPPRE